MPPTDPTPQHASPSPARKPRVWIGTLYILDGITYLIAFIVAIGGLALFHNRPFPYPFSNPAVRYIAGIILGLGIGALMMRLRRLFRRAAPMRRYEQWFAEAVHTASSKEVEVGEHLLDHTVIASAADSLLLRHSAAGWSSTAARIALCLIATAAAAIIVIYVPPIGILPMLLLPGIAVVFAMKPYPDRTSISPTAADGEPGFLFEKRIWVVKRQYKPLALRNVRAIEVREQGDNTGTVDVCLVLHQGAARTLASAQVSEEHRIEAWRLQALLQRLVPMDDNTLP